MPTVLITGGTGLIGTALTRELLKRNYEVIILSRTIHDSGHTRRNKLIPESRVSFATWNIAKQTIDNNAISKSDHIIHLAGENLGDKRWSEKQKKKIIESRTLSSDLVVKALKEIPNHVKTIVSAAAVGWYQAENVNPGTRHIETDPPAEDFLGKTCQQWEASIAPVVQLGKRLITLRTGIALSNDGGVFVRFKLPLRFGFATVLGSGKQVMSWIHIDDLVRMYIYAIEHESISGVYNAVSPQPVTNKTFVMELGKKLKGRFFIPFYVPGFLLKTIFGEMSIEVLKSNNVSCEKIQGTGFEFLYPTLDSAILQLLGG
jgi:uncharacterized protein (TIGR01777 family)